MENAITYFDTDLLIYDVMELPTMVTEPLEITDIIKENYNNLND